MAAKTHNLGLGRSRHGSIDKISVFKVWFCDTLDLEVDVGGEEGVGVWCGT